MTTEKAKTTKGLDMVCQTNPQLEESSDDIPNGLLP